MSSRTSTRQLPRWRPTGGRRPRFRAGIYPDGWAGCCSTTALGSWHAGAAALECLLQRHRVALRLPRAVVPAHRARGSRLPAGTTPFGGRIAADRHDDAQGEIAVQVITAALLAHGLGASPQPGDTEGFARRDHPTRTARLRPRTRRSPSSANSTARCRWSCRVLATQFVREARRSSRALRCSVRPTGGRGVGLEPRPAARSACSLGRHPSGLRNAPRHLVSRGRRNTYPNSIPSFVSSSRSTISHDRPSSTIV